MFDTSRNRAKKRIPIFAPFLTTRLAQSKLHWGVRTTTNEAPASNRKTGAGATFLPAADSYLFPTASRMAAHARDVGGLGPRSRCCSIRCPSGRHRDNSDGRTFLVCLPLFLQSAEISSLVQVDHRFYIETRIDQRDVTPNGDISMLWRRRRQLPVEVRRRWVHFLAEILIERSALTKPGLLIV